jgi:hypothetical protein
MCIVMWVQVLHVKEGGCLEDLGVDGEQYYKGY